MLAARIKMGFQQLMVEKLASLPRTKRFDRAEP
jgi:hypothetical protein